MKHDSCAAKVLKAIVENKRYKIYSFNYTDLLEEAWQLGINQEISYLHVHGNIKDRTSILGIRDDNSRMKILSQLREMNNYQTERLINSNDFKIFTTKNIDQKKFDEFLNYINCTFARNIL